MDHQESLINQLKDFGLNPRFWLLKKLKQKNIWMVIHKDHQELCLKGRINSDYQWKELEWQI